MDNKNLTALISAFARGYHAKNNNIKIFNDPIAFKLLSDKEIESISNSFIEGIKFFNPDFNGTKDEALYYIMNNQIAPSILGRQAFCEKSLMNAYKFGVKEYLIMASGYDTFAYRNNTNLKVFEIDKESMIKDKLNRLEKAKIDNKDVTYVSADFSSNNWIKTLLKSGYNNEYVSFWSLLGISYYLTPEEFNNTLNILSGVMKSKSSIVFDYQTKVKDEKTTINEKLAKGAKEEMKGKYTDFEIKNIIERNGFLIYELLDNISMDNEYFYDYNTLNQSNQIHAPKGVKYVLIVKE